MRVYTRAGDSGLTSLRGGYRIPKSAIILDAIGNVDETNAHLGLVLVFDDVPEQLASQLSYIQNWLFDIGAQLSATAVTSAKECPWAERTRQLESWMDEFDKDLPRLTKFILPGGSQPGALMHVARGVCRRAERSIAVLDLESPLTKEGFAFVNRLGDWMFVAARWVNLKLGAEEHIWVQD